jgi:N-acetylglutamate synthase-like GNAT family acetyltransferase
MTTYTIHTDKNITAQEFDALMASNGWGNDGFFTEALLSDHFSKVRHFAYVRSDSSLLIGYMSAVFNGFASIIIDTMAIHPDFSQDDIGHMLLEEITRQSNGYPLYATPFHDQQDIFKKEGFRIPGRPMVALSRW